MGSFAPGPWHRDGRYIYAVDHGKRYRVASVNNPLFTPEANIANAELIAAAPEMYRALQSTLLVFNQPPATIDPVIALATIEKVRDTLSKITKD
jgi:hypothetical protein